MDQSSVACRSPARLTSTHRRAEFERAHREAYTRITVAQAEFPQILSAYEAVERWVQQNGKEMLGPPREVYFGDFAHLAPNDEGCDIAFPIT